MTFGLGPGARGRASLGRRARSCSACPAPAEERYALARDPARRRHNVENILAARDGGAARGAPPAAVQEALDSVEPLPHRLALVGERARRALVDDSKATNVGAR